MGGVPVKHHTKGKVGRRRSHHALKPTNLLACTECKAPVLPHRVCGNCGTLQTRSIRAEGTHAPKKSRVAVPTVGDVTEVQDEPQVEGEEASEEENTVEEVADEVAGDPASEEETK